MTDQSLRDDAIEAVATLARLDVIGEALAKGLSNQLQQDPARAGRSIRKALMRHVKAEYRRQWVCTELDAKRRLWVKLGQPLDAQLITGTFEVDNTALIMRGLTPGGTFVDIGTNIGWFSINAGGWYADNGGGQVISVEPIPEVFERFSESVRMSGLGDIVKAHNIAIAGEDTELAFHLSGDHLAGSHLVANTAAKETDIIVKARRASTVLDPTWRVDFVKIDIEGAEPGFFDHAQEFLKATKPPILSEVHGPKLMAVSNASVRNYIDQVAAIGYTPYLVGKRARLTPLSKLAPLSDAEVVNVLFLTSDQLDRFGASA